MSIYIDQTGNLTLRDLLDLPGIEDLSRHVKGLYGVCMAIVNESGEILFENGSADGRFRQDWQKFTAGLRDLTVKRGESRDLPLPGNLFFRVLPIINELETVGLVVLGPCEPEKKGPAFDDAAAFVRNILDLLVFNNYRRYLTNQAHLESIEESYRALQKANAELQISYEQLKEVDQMKSNFLAVVSHELRTPLTSVIGYSEMLLEGIAGELNESQGNYVKVIMEKGDQLLTLIREILDLSKIEAGKMKPVIRTVDPREIINLAVETVRPIAEKNQIALSLQIAKALPTQAKLDREKLLQVLNNLLSNALKFTREGGKVQLVAGFASANQCPGPPDLQQTAGDYLFCMIEDTGIGIAPEHLEKIFVKFYQVDNSSTRAFGGTGLGLSITQSFVEMHGGKIWVESEVKRGTRMLFTFSLTMEPTSREGAEFDDMELGD